MTDQDLNLAFYPGKHLVYTSINHKQKKLEDACQRPKRTSIVECPKSR